MHKMSNTILLWDCVVQWNIDTIIDGSGLMNERLWFKEKHIDQLSYFKRSLGKIAAVCANFILLVIIVQYRLDGLHIGQPYL